MEAVAAGNEVATDFLRLAVLCVAHRGLVRIETVKADIWDRIQGGQPGRFAGVHQIMSDLGLAVDHDLLAAAERVNVDAVPAAVEAQFNAMMGQTFRFEPLIDTRLSEQVDSTLLQNACADAAEDMGLAAQLEHDVADAFPVQQLAEKKPGWPSADDHDLRSHSNLLILRFGDHSKDGGLRREWTEAATTWTIRT